MYIHIDDSNTLLHGYSDASYAEDRTDRKSISGYLFKLFGALISWSTREQTCVSLSFTEAEFIALTETIIEGLWLKQLLNDINFQINYPINIYRDNTSCIKMISSEKVDNRTEHIDVRYYFAKNLLMKETFKRTQFSTNEMQADVLTKPSTATKIQQFIKDMKIMN